MQTAFLTDTEVEIERRDADVIPLPGDCFETARGGWALIARERHIGTVKDAAAPFDAGAQEGAGEGVVYPVRHGLNGLDEAVE